MLTTVGMFEDGRDGFGPDGFHHGLSLISEKLIKCSS